MEIPMKNPLNRLLLTGILFVSVTGTLAHFVYDWSGQNSLLGFFVPINESIWEHIKLLFFPMLLFTAYAAYRRDKQYPGLSTALMWGILSGCLLIPTLYYTYTGAFGFHSSVIDIGIFFVSVLATFFVAHYLQKKHSSRLKSFLPGLLILLLWGACIAFTLVPPPLPLFANP